MKYIDLNSDVGESYGRYILGDETNLFPLITSANIACGFHAGDPLVILKTIQQAITNHVAIGAHPGYPDLQGFGRRYMDLSSDELEALVLYQISAVAGIARACGGKLIHVKPHGALYNVAAGNRDTARAIARAICRYDEGLILVGMAGSEIIAAGKEFGLRVANEGFPDRLYLADGTLAPRKMAGSVLDDEEAVSQRALKMVMEGICMEKEGKIERVVIDTLCIHGDNPSATKLAGSIRRLFEQEQIIIRRLDDLCN